MQPLYHFFGIVAFHLASAIAPTEATSVSGAQSPPPSTSGNLLWYNDISGDEWISQGLPIGNGFQAAMVFSGVDSDRFQLNHHSLWTGGPFQNKSYTGNNADPSQKSNKAAGIASLRKEIWSKGQVPVEDATTLYGSFDNYGSYRYLTNLFVNATNSTHEVSNYSRWLDLDTALAGSTYGMPDGTTVNKTSFCSYPDQVCVFNVMTTGASSRMYTIGFTNDDSAPPPNMTCNGSDGIILRGIAEDTASAMVFEAQLIVSTLEGNISCRDGVIMVQGSKQVTAVVSSGTNFDQENGNAAAKFSFKGPDPHAQINENIKKASAKTYNRLRSTHVADYQKLYNNFKLSWNAQVVEQPTNVQVAKYREDPNNPYLEWLAFNYGRYLLIASSRPGSLPVNLQGKWADGLSPPWSADYHLDINLQMNYWAAQTTGLSETALPMVEYLAKNYIPRGKRTADIHYSARGFIAHEENNIFGSTGPRSGGEYAIFALGSTWMSMQAWDHFDYTQDTKWLQSQGWDILKESSLFWIDYLTLDKHTNDGLLVAAPCGSSEHGNVTFGCTQFQNVIWETFQNTRKAFQFAKDSNASFLTELEATINKTDKGLYVGKWGQLQEWKLDLDLPDDQHRHLSNLISLFPGYLVSSIEPKFKSAAEVSLIHRGPGIEDSDAGWEKVWRSGCWAALGNATQAKYELQLTIQRDFTENLFDNYTSTIFQIDANLGYPAAVMQMLFQDPDTVIGGRQSALFKLLPAWPFSWSTQGGSVSGLRGRGGYRLSFEWDDKNAIKTLIIEADKAPSDRQIEIVVERWMSDRPKIVSSHGDKKPVLSISGTTVSFLAKAKHTYTLE